MKTCIQILGLLAITASLSFGEKAPKPPGAEGKKRPNPEKVFAKLDADSSGSVSLEEFKASPRAQKSPEKAEEIYKKMDADGANGISLEEFKAHGPQKGPKKGPNGPKGPGAPEAPTPAAE